MKKLWGVALLGLILALSLASLGCGNNSTSTTETNTQTGANTVSIENFKFVPADLTVSIGDTVTWINNDSTNHTVTGDKTGTDDDFDSGILKPGDQYTYVFDQSGPQPYHCTIHSSMKATVTVSGGTSGSGTSSPGGTTNSQSPY